MLQDRPYMRESYDTPRTSILTWLVSLIAAVFIIQMVGRVPLLHTRLEGLLGLSSVSLQEGHVWTLLSYAFLHDTTNVLQPVFFILAIYFIGREILPILGPRRFVLFYLGAVLVGGLTFTAVHWRQPVLLTGASAAVWALITLNACFFPDRERTVLLFFVAPVTFRPRTILYILLGIDLLGLVFYELLGASDPFGAAHSAHLGGMLVGWIYFRYLHEPDWSLAAGRAEITLPRWMKTRAAAKAAAPVYTVNTGDRGHLRAEVDRILDKINSHGFGSLSAEEKKKLDEARDLIGRR